MERVIHVCDICERETNYKPNRSERVGWGSHNWVFRDTETGKRALVCSHCNHVLNRAGLLGITVSKPPDTITAGGALIAELVELDEPIYLGD